jgi:phage tail sheath protein FI
MIDLGRLYCEIGVNPVKPAEFVIIRIGQWSSGGNVSEA